MNPTSPLGVSVVICCYNSALRLPETLKHLLAQDAPADLPWEVIVVDNASTDDTAQVARSFWPDDAPVLLRVVSEPEPGLKHARRRGFQEARYELVSFVDDDNWLESNWVKLVAEIMVEHPEVGACSGRTQAVTEIEAPAWFAEYASGYVIGEQGDKIGDVTWSRGHLWGAGLTVRKSAWFDLCSLDFSTHLSGRKAKNLSSGEDYELCYALRLAGWRLWYSDKLILRHFISAERLTLDYLSRLKTGFGAQTIGHDPYWFYVRHHPSEIKSLFGKIWLRQLLRELYIAMFRDRSFWWSQSKHSSVSLSHKMQWMFHKGRIFSLLQARKNYDNQIIFFDKNPWIRIARQSANYLYRNPTFSDAGNPELVRNPLVTALICNYNYGRYLAEAINSALAQTWKNLEVLVVDDGSTDHSREVLKRYEGRIRTILKENGGQASAFNVGIAEARGEIICFLDSDDLWHPDKVARVVAKYQEAPWGLVCHDMAMIDSNGDVLSGVNWTQFAGITLHGGNLLVDEIVDDGYPWIFSPTTGMSLPTTLARRLLLLPEAEWRICADTPLAYAAVCHAPVGVLETTLGNYRLHGSNGFSVAHADPVAMRIVAVVHPAQRHLFLSDYLHRLGRGLDRTPLDNYRYFRRCRMIAAERPWRALPELWRRNLANLRTDRSTAHFLLADPLLVFAILLGLPISYRKFRARFREEARRLDSRILAYISGEQGDDADTRR